MHLQDAQSTSWLAMGAGGQQSPAEAWILQEEGRRDPAAFQIHWHHPHAGQWRPHPGILLSVLRMGPIKMPNVLLLLLTCSAILIQSSSGMAKRAKIALLQRCEASCTFLCACSSFGPFACLYFQVAPPPGDGVECRLPLAPSMLIMKQRHQLSNA